MGPNSGPPITMLQKHSYLLGFCLICTPEALQEVNIGHLGSTMLATPLFGVKIGPEVAPCTQFLKLNDARKGYHEPTMSNKIRLPTHKVPKIMRTKAKKAPMCSVSLIAKGLKGLAALGEALKNNRVNFAEGGLAPAKRLGS